MIYINTSVSGTTFSMYLKDPSKGGGKFLMVLYNSLLKETKRFILTDTTPAIKPSTFLIETTNDPTAEDMTIPKLYLWNWLGYNSYKIYYKDGIVTSYNMSEDDLLSNGFMYVYNDESCYSPTTGTTTLDYDFTYICLSATTSSGSTPSTTGDTSGIGSGVPSGITDLVLWLRPEELSGLTDGADVESWTDVSGRVKNGLTYWDSPTWDATAGTIGAVKFSGITSNPQFFTIDDMDLTNEDDLTIFMVYQSVLSADTTLLMAQYDCYGGFCIGANPNDDGSLRFKGHQNVFDTGAVTAAAYLDNTFKQSTFIYDSLVEVYVNGIASGEVVGSTILEGSYKTWYIGLGIPYSDYQYANTFYTGYMSEIIVYDRKLTSAEQLLITNYLTGKYGV